MKIYDLIFRGTPTKYRRWVKSYLNYAEFSISVERYVGFSIFFGFALGSSLAYFLFMMKLLSLVSALLVGVGTFLTFTAAMHAIPVMISDKRVKFVDELLPDVLRLVSSNLKSGLTPDKSLLLSAREEFGTLEKQIRKAAKQTLAGKPIEESLKTIPENINSSVLRRTIDLLIEGISRGGNLASLLDGLAEDIRQSRILKKEVSAFVMMYTIFIFFAAGFGAPVLYAISSFLVQTMIDIGGVNVQQSFTAEVPAMSFKAVEIEPSFLTFYSLSSLIITSVFGGILIGLILDGNERAGLRYIPILVLLSVGVFFATKMMVFRMFGATMGI